MMPHSNVPEFANIASCCGKITHRWLGLTYLEPYHFLADHGRNPFKVPFILRHARLPLQREEARCFQGKEAFHFLSE